MKNIIHDWPDDRAQQILKTVRGAARDGATLLLVECVIPPHDRDFVAKWSDLGMLVDNTGRERTADEYRDLLHHVGLPDDTRGANGVTVQHRRSQGSLTVDFATILTPARACIQQAGVRRWRRDEYRAIRILRVRQSIYRSNCKAARVSPRSQLQAGPHCTRLFLDSS